MGQYHITCNFTKREFLHPHDLGLGLKQLEQVGFDGSTGDILVMLLSCSNERGGGDFTNVDGLLGRWAGDQIAVVGDYAEDADMQPFFHAGRTYRDAAAWAAYTQAGEPADVRGWLLTEWYGDVVPTDPDGMQYLQEGVDCLSDPSRRWTNISALLYSLIEQNCGVRIAADSVGWKRREAVT